MAGQPQTNCLTAMDYPEDVMNNLHLLNIQHLRSLEQGQDILANHRNNDNTTEETADEPPAKKAAVDDGSNGDIKPKPVRMSLREKSVASYDKMLTQKSDGLIIVCKQHPAQLLVFLSKVRFQQIFVLFN